MPGTVCIVDDEVEILNTLGGILTDEGYQVTVVKGGGDALKVIQAESPDVVILDIWMPKTRRYGSAATRETAISEYDGDYDVRAWIR